MSNKMPWMNERGIVLKFIISILIALIIFVPTILFASELFRVSDQAKGNLQSFTKELRQFAISSEDTKTFLSIMDSETVLLLFKEKDHILFFQEALPSPPVVEYKEYYFSYPEAKCQGKLPCACLCSKFDLSASEETDSQTTASSSTKTYKTQCTKLICESLSGIPLKESWVLHRGLEDQRRNPLLFEKENGEISVRKQ